MAFMLHSDASLATTANPNWSGSSYIAIPRQYSASDAKLLRTQVRQALQQGVREVVVDCAAWNELDLSMLSSLIQCVAACNECGASIKVANMSGAIRENVRDLQLSGRLGLGE